MANPSLIVGSVNSEVSVATGLVHEAGIAHREKAHRLRDMDILANLWRACKKVVDDEQSTTGTNIGDLANESSDKRTTALSEFQLRHGFSPVPM